MIILNVRTAQWVASRYALSGQIRSLRGVLDLNMADTPSDPTAGSVRTPDSNHCVKVNLNILF